MSKLNEKEKASLKRYIDDYLQKFLTIPIDIFAAIVRNFPTDYDLNEIAKMLNLRSVVVNNLDKVVEDDNIDLFVNTLTENEHPDLIYFWNLLSKSYACFTQPIIDKYVDKWDWSAISELNPSDEFIEKNLPNINWSCVECTEKTLAFFRKYEDKIHFDKVDWGSLSWDVVKNYIHKAKEIKFKTKEDEKGFRYGSCVNEFIEQYKEFVPVKTYMEVLSNSMDNIPSDWKSISQYYQLDESFLNDLAHRVDWELVSECQDMSLGFMFKHEDKIKIDALAKNVKIPQNVKDEFLSQANIEDIEGIEEDCKDCNCEDCDCEKENNCCGNCDSCDNHDCENNMVNNQCISEDDGSQPTIITTIFTDEKFEKEIVYSCNLSENDPSKKTDYAKMLESVESTYGIGQMLECKNKQGKVRVKYIVEKVDMDTLKEEIDEFFEERGWKK